MPRSVWPQVEPSSHGESVSCLWSRAPTRVSASQKTRLPSIEEHVIVPCSWAWATYGRLSAQMTLPRIIEHIAQRTALLTFRLPNIVTPPVQTMHEGDQRKKQ